MEELKKKTIRLSVSNLQAPVEAAKQGSLTQQAVSAAGAITDKVKQSFRKVLPDAAELWTVKVSHGDGTFDLEDGAGAEMSRVPSILPNAASVIFEGTTVAVRYMQSSLNRPYIKHLAPSNRKALPVVVAVINWPEFAANKFRGFGFSYGLPPKGGSVYNGQVESSDGYSDQRLAVTVGSKIFYTSSTITGNNTTATGNIVIWDLASNEDPVVLPMPFKEQVVDFIVDPDTYDIYVENRYDFGDTRTLFRKFAFIDGAYTEQPTFDGSDHAYPHGWVNDFGPDSFVGFGEWVGSNPVAQPSLTLLDSSSLIFLAAQKNEVFDWAWVLRGFLSDLTLPDPTGGNKLSTHHFIYEHAPYNNLDLPELLVYDGGFSNEHAQDMFLSCFPHAVRLYESDYDDRVDTPLPTSSPMTHSLKPSYDQQFCGAEVGRGFFRAPFRGFFFRGDLSLAEWPSPWQGYPGDGYMYDHLNLIYAESDLGQALVIPTMYCGNQINVYPYPDVFDPAEEKNGKPLWTITGWDGQPAEVSSVSDVKDGVLNYHTGLGACSGRLLAIREQRKVKAFATDFGVHAGDLTYGTQALIDAIEAETGMPIGDTPEVYQNGAFAHYGPYGGHISGIGISSDPADISKYPTLFTLYGAYPSDPPSSILGPGYYFMPNFWFRVDPVASFGNPIASFIRDDSDEMFDQMLDIMKNHIYVAPTTYPSPPPNGTLIRKECVTTEQDLFLESIDLDTAEVKASVAVSSDSITSTITLPAGSGELLEITRFKADLTKLQPTLVDVWSLLGIDGVSEYKNSGIYMYHAGGYVWTEVQYAVCHPWSIPFTGGDDSERVNWGFWDCTAVGSFLVQHTGPPYAGTPFESRAVLGLQLGSPSHRRHYADGLETAPSTIPGFKYGYEFYALGYPTSPSGGTGVHPAWLIWGKRYTALTIPGRRQVGAPYHHLRAAFHEASKTILFGPKDFKTSNIGALDRRNDDTTLADRNGEWVYSGGWAYYTGAVTEIYHPKIREVTRLDSTAEDLALVAFDVLTLQQKFKKSLPDFDGFKSVLTINSKDPDNPEAVMLRAKIRDTAFDYNDSIETLQLCRFNALTGEIIDISDVSSADYPVPSMPDYTTRPRNSFSGEASLITCVPAEGAVLTSANTQLYIIREEQPP